MSRLPQETYRNFFNRLVGFVRQHLPDKQYSAEGVTSPNTGEKLTIGLLDSIAVHWLLAIDKRLIGIVKTEFAADLKTKRLCQMIKQIAPNVDDLLTRYGHQDSINSVAATCTPSAVNLPKSTPPSEDTTIDMIINRIERLEKTQQPRRSQTNRFKSRNKFTENCVHCSFLNKQLETTFNNF